MNINGRERHLFLYYDSAMVVDATGGASVTSFTDEEATALFLEWLRDKRELEAEREAELAQHAAQAAQRALVQAAKAGRAGLAVIEGGCGE